MVDSKESGGLTYQFHFLSSLYSFAKSATCPLAFERKNLAKFSIAQVQRTRFWRANNMSALAEKVKATLNGEIRTSIFDPKNPTNHHSTSEGDP